MIREIKTQLPQEGTGTAGESVPECNSGSPIVSGGDKFLIDGDALCHGSRHVSPVSPNGKKRAKECQIATMNVCGSMDSKIDEVCEMMSERRIDVLGVSETKKKGCSITTYDRYTGYWSGVNDSERSSQGVGVILSERMNASVKEFEFVSPRLLWIRLKVGLTRIFLLCAYAPDMSKPPKVREDFWDSVREIMTKCKENERIILIGDFNGWVGIRRDGYERNLGMFGDKRVNENGESLLEVCLERNLVVTNTLFSHKLIHMYTWQRQTERSMIDFVIVDERLRAKVKDTRVYRGDWSKAVIVPLYKGSGSQQECKNFRGISLLSVVGKLYARILIKRVMNETEKLAQHQKVFCAFIDLEKAYDRVERNELWSTLAMYGVLNQDVPAHEKSMLVIKNTNHVKF
ncbi:craniofacial development protein 2-like [Galleria mellonella]|uniref:Craniofacial development protein 2-like n=1 Tax=Galleria mellonella TaxID=7137 RepID=A0ABM3MQP1_GALME|nr:craniofacial development protein 2-like [Galleria mellonella]